MASERGANKAAEAVVQTNQADIGMIDEWKRTDKKKQISHFGPSFMRDALDKRDGYTSGERKRIYNLISELASHASYSGISLTIMGPANMAPVGPFFDEKKLATWLHELAVRGIRRFTSSAMASS